MDTISVDIPRRFNLSTLRQLSSAWPRETERIVLDFENQQFVYPTGTVGLACLVEQSLRQGQQVVASMGGCRNASYWSRMGFFDVLDIAGAPARGNRHEADGRFCEICRVDDLHQVDTLTDRMVEVLRPPIEIRAVFAHVISEALNNVCQHSDASGFCAAQLYQRERIVRLCIADPGRGLRASLGRHSPRDDQHAVELAMQPGISGPNPHAVRLQSRPYRNRGVGLSVARRLVEENGGALLLWSGEGIYPSMLSGERETGTAPWDGTLLAAKMQREHAGRGLADVLRDVSAELGKRPRRPRRLRRLP